ncbi:MAG TPA: hypothetical protein VGI76_10175 [Solirubrobacteraceae bacterium]|jgi:hypothetical protein
MSKKLAIAACTGLLLLSALALTSTASAQWMVNGTNLTTNQALASGAPTDKVVEIKVAGVAVVCAGVELTSPQIEPGDTASTSSLVFANCSANGGCTIEKNIHTVPLTATATLGGTLAANIIFKPKTKTVFGTLKFEGAECPLLGTQVATGSAKFLVPTGRDEKLFQALEAEVTEASGELKAGGSSVGLTGSSLLKLSTDLPWSFL